MAQKAAPPSFPLKIRFCRMTLVDSSLLRRAESRIAFKMFVKLSDPATGAFEITSTINVSCHGARLVTKNLWETNHDLFLQPIRGSLPSRGRVAHCETRQDGSYEIGLELYPPTEDWTRSGKLPSKPLQN
jgi:PilZ domain-containing protein